MKREPKSIEIIERGTPGTQALIDAYLKLIRAPEPYRIVQ
jgi:hypothetical protein